MRLLDLIYEAIDDNPEIDGLLKSILQHSLEAQATLDSGIKGTNLPVMQAVDVEEADRMNAFIRDALKSTADVDLEVYKEHEASFKNWVKENNYNVLYYLCYILSFPLFLDKLLKRYEHSEFVIKGSEYDIPVVLRKIIFMYRKTPWKFKLILDNSDTNRKAFGSHYIVHLMLNIQRFTQEVDFHVEHWQDLFIDFKRSATFSRDGNAPMSSVKFDNRMAYTYEKSGRFRLKDINMSCMNDILDKK